MRWLLISSLMLPVLLVGCADNTADPQPTTTENTPAQREEQAAEETVASSAPGDPSSSVENSQPASLPELPVIMFGGDNASGAQTAAKRGANSPVTAGQQSAEAAIAKLKELQILLGSWRGITQKEYGGFKAVDTTEWVWDFKTNPQQPALVMESEQSPYYRRASLTYLPDSEQYQLTVTDPEGKTGQYFGKFQTAIADEQGDDGKPQRTYKLELTQQDASSESLRFVINQQNNNRYLLEIYRQRGSNDRFFRVDTVSTQREGTSLAMIDEGYGEKTCIISGGLGTITVSHQGQTYYVCCTGCKAAFEDDPARWIARANEQKK